MFDKIPSMTTVPAPEAVLASMELRNVLELLKHHHQFKNTVDVLISAGVPQGTAYRRLKNPQDLSVAELLAVSTRFSVPLEVLVAGPRPTMKWMLEHPAPSGDGPGAPHPPTGGPVSGESSSACTSLAQVIPFHRRPARHEPAATANLAS